MTKGCLNMTDYYFLWKAYNTVDKYEYVKIDLAKENSIIESLINLEISTIRTIKGFSKLEIDNDAIEILNNITWIQKEKKELLLGFIEYLRTRNK